MGVNSELGPIDPQFNGIPAEFIRDDPAQPHPMKMIAGNAITRTKSLARQVLKDGMLSSKSDAEIDALVEQLGSAQSYCSHGAVINAQDAQSLGLKVSYLQPDNSLWQQLWLLYCMYDFDCKSREYAKVFEGVRYSMARPIPSKSPS